MGMAGQGPLPPRQNHSHRSVLEKSGPYWREMMPAKNMMGHPQDQHRLEKKTKRGTKRKEVKGMSEGKSRRARERVSERGVL